MSASSPTGTASRPAPGSAAGSSHPGLGPSAPRRPRSWGRPADSLHRRLVHGFQDERPALGFGQLVPLLGTLPDHFVRVEATVFTPKVLQKVEVRIPGWAFFRGARVVSGGAGGLGFLTCGGHFGIVFRGVFGILERE